MIRLWFAPRRAWRRLRALRNVVRECARDPGLVLAHSGARYHRFVNAGPEGSLEVPYAVVEQPLPEPFPGRFEGQGLDGRVAFRCPLVRFGAEPRRSLVSVTAADAGRQLALREHELWRSLGAAAP